MQCGVNFTAKEKPSLRVKIVLFLFLIFSFFSAYKELFAFLKVYCLYPCAVNICFRIRTVTCTTLTNMSDNKGTSSDSQNNTENLVPNISETTETHTADETACTKKVFVVLHRLPESIVKSIRSPSQRSPSSEFVNKSSKDILEKCLLPKLESRLTEWIKTKVQKNSNGGRVQRKKIVRRAKRIFESLKAEGGEKYKNLKFVPSKKWFYRYQMKAGWDSKQLSANSSILKQCHCSVVSDARSRSLTLVLESSDDDDDDEEDCSHTVISEGDEDWCSRLKINLINEKARDLMIDTLTSCPCPFLTSSSREDQKSVSERTQAELNKSCDTPMPAEERAMEVVSSCSDSESDQLEITEIVFCPKATSSRVDIEKKSDADDDGDDVKPIIITLDDEEMPQTCSGSTVTVLAPATSNVRDKNCGEVGKNQLQVPFFQSVSPENESVIHFRQKFERIIKQEKYLPQQIFCAQETTLYWKHMPANSGILEPPIEELPESKDPMMLLLCTNASGDCRFEPMLVYSKEDPSSIRHLIKSSLPVIWKFHPRAKITNSLFEDWFTYSFVPTVQVYCIEHRIPFQALLVLNSALCHNPVLEFAHPNVKVVFLTPDIAPYVQPMDLGIITTFKVNYLKRMFQMITESTELQIGETAQSFWNSFNILSALKLIKSAWLDVSQVVVTLAWRIMCLGALPKDSEGGNPFLDAVSHTISAAKCMQVNISERDITNWLYYQSHELTNDELKVLEQRSSAEAASSGNIAATSSRAEEPLARLASSKLLEAFKYLKTAMTIFELEDPNYKRSSYVNEEIRRSYECYREMYSALKKTKGLENNARIYGIKVENDRPHLATNTKSSPSMLAKWLSRSNGKSPQRTNCQFTFNGNNEQNSL